MSVLIEYFSAADRETAARCIDVEGGARAVEGMSSSSVVEVPGLNPVSLLSLGEALGGLGMEDLLVQSGDPVALVDGGAEVVMEVPGSFVAALAAVAHESVAELARAWVEDVVEFTGEPLAWEDAVSILERLRGLAQHVVATGEGMYSYICT